ncbi:D-tyrosyl-tRNA(Tyr) deacylase [Scopulibacillus daqui]|uniref:D-aminoacyl-tRNA deacylase n=1 Tax=Scopulibacillus daqui TaxID=1469162 RepID=A0ABS2PXD4_9BACL|nr:D-aminoacyl-tRNA deacylase [Scopulibacillus daqui]MBM7644686.1 D-tyrosyl-tRNA(Tyr) deacylase [Scopulibacillus daqui]
MKVVVQRAKNAAVLVDGEPVGQIDKGLLLLVGIKHDDTIDDLKYAADKIAGLRIFEDQEGKMNFSVQDVQGDILSVSQFTLYGDVSKGRRPNFMEAAKPDQAEKLYNQFNDILKEKGLRVETGRFGAMMDVSFTNDGPVTLIVESKQKV